MYCLVFIETSRLTDPSPRVSYKLSTYVIPKPGRHGSHCSVRYAHLLANKACKALKKIVHKRIMQELRYVGHDAKQGLLRLVVFILISDKLWKFLSLLF